MARSPEGLIVYFHCAEVDEISISTIAVCTALIAEYRELENMVHGGRPLPTNPAAARPPILWAEDFVAIAGSLPLMDPQGGLKPLPESGPYVQPVSFQGATALHLAAFYGHLAVTDLLLAAGACDVTARNIQVNVQSLLLNQQEDYLVKLGPASKTDGMWQSWQSWAPKQFVIWLLD